MSEPASPREEPAALDLAALKTEVYKLVSSWPQSVTMMHFIAESCRLMPILVDELERCRAERDAVLAIHQKSTTWASRGEHKGKHYCVACTSDVDDFVLYVDWPCKTAAALGEVTQ